MAFVSTTHCGTFCVTRDVVGRGILDAPPVGADIIRPPHGGTGLRRPHFLSKESGGKEREGRGISIFPALHPPLETTQKGVPTPFLDFPPSCPTGNIPAARAYSVTPPPLARHSDRPGISEARHRRRPGGPSWYSVPTPRACRVIPMRATRGAAAPVTKLPGKLAAMHGRSLPCPYSPPPPWTPGPGPAGPGGFPAAFDIKSGAPAG